MKTQVEIAHGAECPFQLLQLAILLFFFFPSFSIINSLSQVELLIPQLQFLDDEGAQAELWELSRVFLDTLIQETGCQVLRQCTMMFLRFTLPFPFVQAVFKIDIKIKRF